MSIFFGFEPTSQGQFLYNFNHLILVFFVIGALLLLFFGLYAKSDKGIRITKIVMASMMALFEGGRYIFLMVYYSRFYGSFDWVGRIPFSMCGIMSITTIFVLYVSAFRKTNGRYMQIFYNILFGCALWGGILTFASPQMLNEGFAIIHFRNVQTIFIHIMLIFVPIYLIKIGELQVRFINFWIIAIGYLSIGIISMTGSQISSGNFANALYIDMLIDWNINIPFPWHLPPMFLAMHLLPAICYSVFEIIYRKKNPQPTESLTKTSSSTGLNTAQFSRAQWLILGCGFIMSFVLHLFISSLLGPTPEASWLGLLCLIPLGILAGSIWFVHKNTQKGEHMPYQHTV